MKMWFASFFLNLDFCCNLSFTPGYLPVMFLGTSKPVLGLLWLMWC